MPQRRCAVKRLRIDKKRRLQNLRAKVGLKKALKKFQSLVAAKNSAEATAFLREVSSKLDKSARKGIITKNTASRKKSRLALMLAKING